MGTTEGAKEKKKKRKVSRCFSPTSSRSISSSSLYSRFLDETIFQDKDTIRLGDTRQPMSNCNRRSSSCCLVESFLNDLLGFRVQSRSGFIQQKNLWISDNRPRNGDTFCMIQTRKYRMYASVPSLVLRSHPRLKSCYSRFCPPES